MHMPWRGSNPVRLQGLGLDICPVMSLSASDILDKCIGMDPFFWWSENALPNGIGVRYSREPPKG
jgi:hypothetical protein